MSRASILALVVTLLGMTGCAQEKDYVDAMREQRAAYRELTQVLASIRDEKSMEEGKALLEKRLEKFEQAAAKIRALPRPSAELLAKLQKEANMNRAIEDLQYEVGQVRQLPGGPAFLKQFATASPGLLSAEQP
jgi:ABC-type nitrate/sulfonate/bicarbonate transport system substrate-binding protein